MFHVPEQYRVKHGPLASSEMDGNNGAFFIQYQSYRMFVVASDGMGWEHVSVSLPTNRCPNWAEMCFIKDQFWGPEDCVVQFHPPKSEYVNMHNFTLHLWRKIGEEVPRPDPIMVGVNLGG